MYFLCTFRYDGRGHLYDLSTYDASRVKPGQMSEDEKHIEALCDEERYLELKHDLAEKQMYEDEEWKRYYQSLSEGFNAVGFSYDHQHYQDYMQTAESAEPEPIFKAPEELQIPPDMEIPDSEKQHAIIEKTAKFIAGHGVQMEIIIKTKQTKNTQFNFLHFEDPLSNYYKHMVKMIKSGKYKPKDIKEEDNDKDEDVHSQHGYLHPSLVNTTIPTPMPNLAPAVKMPAVAIHDTPYGKLIKHLKKSTPDTERNSDSPQPVKDAYSGSYSPQPHSNTPPPESNSAFIQQSTDYHHIHPGLPPPPGLEPVTLPTSNQPPPPGTEVEGPLLPPHLQQQVLQEELLEEEKPPSVQNPPVMGPSLEPKVIPPPPDIQPIIDRMAMYVAKNGVEFEIVVRSKNDQRFEFLQPWHSYFRYYNSKKKIFIEEVLKEREKQEKEKPAKLSFSIKNKTKEQDGVVSSEKKVFDHDSSGEDDSESTRDRSIKSDMSGTSTPVEGEIARFSSDEKSGGHSEISEKKQAEEKLKDKLALAAREKLSKASREKQIQAERKRKAAMFINMLKSTKSSDKEDSKSGSTPSGSRSHTPASFDETKEDGESRKAKTKSKRQRSRSPRRSKRSHSKSRSPRRRKSPTPPSAYTHIQRSDSRSPTRYKAPRQTSPYRRRSRSPNYKKRSRSPCLIRNTDSTARSSKKSKKKKRSRSKSRSPSRKSKSSRGEKKTEETSIDYASLEMESVKERLSSSPQLFSTSNISDISTTEKFRISQPIDDDSNSAISTDTNSKNVSNYMLSRVRALIKASREAVKKEEDIFDDS